MRRIVNPIDTPGFTRLRVFKIRQGGRTRWFLGMYYFDARMVAPGGVREPEEPIEIADIGPEARRQICMEGE